MYVTWLIHTCDMTHSYVWHDSIVYVTWLIQRTADEGVRSLICVTWLVHTCEMSNPYGCHDSSTCMMWPYERVMSHVWMSHGTLMDVTWLLYKLYDSYAWHASCIRVKCQIHMVAMTYPYLWREYMTESCHTYEWVMPPTWTWHDSSICYASWHDSFVRDTTQSMHHDMTHSHM